MDRMNLEMSEVRFLEDFKLEVLLTNGDRIIYSLKLKRTTARFKEIEDWDRFCGGKVIDGNRIVWPNETELSIDEILYELRMREADQCLPI